MMMTDGEILRSYRNASKKKMQITILSELNACDKDTIKKILIRNGIPAEEFQPKRRESYMIKKEPAKKAKEGNEKVETEKKSPVEKTKEFLESQQDKPLQIPDCVKKACNEKIESLMQQIASIEREMNELVAFLKEV